MKPTRADYRDMLEPLMAGTVTDALTTEGLARRGMSFTRTTPDAVQRVEFDFLMRPMSFRAGAQLTCLATCQFAGVAAALRRGMPEEQARRRSKVAVSFRADPSTTPSKVWGFAEQRDVEALQASVHRALAEDVLPLLRLLGSRSGAADWARARFNSALLQFGMWPGEDAWFLCGLLLDQQRAEDALDVLRRSYPEGSRDYPAALDFERALD